MDRGSLTENSLRRNSQPRRAGQLSFFGMDHFYIFVHRPGKPSAIWLSKSDNGQSCVFTSTRICFGTQPDTIWRIVVMIQGWCRIIWDIRISLTQSDTLERRRSGLRDCGGKEAAFPTSSRNGSRINEWSPYQHERPLKNFALRTGASFKTITPSFTPRFF